MNQIQLPRLHRILLYLLIASVVHVGTHLGEQVNANEPSKQRPNIIVIVADDMGFSDLGCYGGEIDTPHLDRLAIGGVRLVDFHNNAKCSETRASLLTGLWHHQSKNLSKPGHVTIAEVLRDAGYSTMMSGKWHLHGTPKQRGFDRFFGFLSGAINFFTGSDWQTGENLMRLDDEAFVPDEDFYSTDAFTDHAIKFLDEARQSDKPYFLYLAHNAPHFPLHALPEDIAKYRGRFDAGWDKLRESRFAHMKKMGLIDSSWKLSGRDPKVESWEQMSASEKSFLLPMIEVYAAMVDRLDQNIGRLISDLESNGELDNTFIVFFSDNGACPYQRLRSDQRAPGTVDSDIAYDARWANFCNTPLRLYKQYAHHGGTLTPMIAHWPAGINRPGSVSRAPGHIVDIMPTCVELAAADYPVRRDGDKIRPMEGSSLISAVVGNTSGPDKTVREKPIYWEFSGNHAIRDGDWKLVAARGEEWELYHVAEDPCETADLASQQLDLVQKLAGKYDQWAKRVSAKQHSKASKMKPSGQSQLFDLDEILQAASN